MKREALNHTKMKRLCRSLDIRPYVAVGIMESFWHLTSKEAPQGDIGKLSNQDIADAIGWEGSEEKLIAALISARWVDRDPIVRLIVHDWHEHCDDFVDMKVARSTLFYANGAKARMNRLAVSERTKIEEHFALQTPIRAHSVPSQGTASHKTSPGPEHVFDRKSSPDTVPPEKPISLENKENGDNGLFVRTESPEEPPPCLALPCLAVPSQALPLSLSLPSLDFAPTAKIAKTENGASALLKSSNGKTPEYKLDAFSEWAHDVYDRHPKQKNQFAVLHALKQTFAGKPTEQQLLDENHPLWIAYWQLDPNYPRFVPVLAETNGGGWINDQAWRKKPPPPPVADTKHARAKAWADKFKGETQ